MRKLIVALTASLSAEWGFAHPSDFERAGAASVTLLRTRKMVDVGDLQALIDTITTVFDARPAEGEMTFGFTRAEEAATA